MPQQRRKGGKLEKVPYYDGLLIMYIAREEARAAYKVANPSAATNDNLEKTWQRIVVLKEHCVCAVKVPCAFGAAAEGEMNYVMCVFHGHHYLPCSTPTEHRCL